MNSFWKEFLIILIEVIIVSLILYDIIRKRRETDRLSFLLMCILLLIISVHLIINSKNMLYNFGFWFYCHY